MQGVGRVAQSRWEKIRAIDDVHGHLVSVTRFLAHVVVGEAIRELLCPLASRVRWHSEAKVERLVLIISILLPRLADMSAVQVD